MANRNDPQSFEGKNNVSGGLFGRRGRMVAKLERGKLLGTEG
jgi:hypothetical protein